MSNTVSDAEFARNLEASLNQQERAMEEKDWEMAQQLHEQVTGTTATDFSCAMCFEEFKGTTDLNKGVVTSCQHKFCMVCFLKYVETREQQIVEQIEKARNPDKVERDIKCPLCRSSIIEDANRIRVMHKKAPVHIPQHANIRKNMTWDPAASVVVACSSCKQRLLAPPGKVVKCVCKNLIKPQQTSTLWRSDSQLISSSRLPESQRHVSLVLCPGCSRTFTAKAGETIRCLCGTGLYVPLAARHQQQQPQQQQQQQQRVAS